MGKKIWLAVVTNINLRDYVTLKEEQLTSLMKWNYVLKDHFLRHYTISTFD